MKYFYLFVFAILLYGCKTNPPSSPVNITLPEGKVYITSNVDSAKIFLDGNNTGKFTPDTLTAKIGTHIIRLEKENYSLSEQQIDFVEDSVFTVSFTLQLGVAKIVLLEDFANVSCIPCVTSNKIIENLTSSYGPKKLVAIKYPTNFPAPNDPFYNANPQDCNARISYYNIFSAPTTIIDGMGRPTSTDSIAVKDSIETRLQLQPKFEIVVNDTIENNQYKITVNLKVIDNTNLNFDDLILHTVVTETDIEFSSPPGSNGETKFYDVMRSMLPTNNGESLSGINQSGENTFNRQLNIDAGWNANELNCVAFIQNVSTKEVYQTGSTH